MPNEIAHKMRAKQNERLARELILLSPQLTDFYPPSGRKPPGGRIVGVKKV